jgi:hypothetical protein
VCEVHHEIIEVFHAKRIHLHSYESVRSQENLVVRGNIFYSFITDVINN